MKKLHGHNPNLDHAELICSDQQQSKLWKYAKDKYTVTATWRKTPVITFESILLSKLLEDNESTIEHFVVLNVTNLNIEEPHGFIELRIFFENGRAYSIDTFEDMASLTYLETPDRPENSDFSVANWGLPNEKPYASIRLTPMLGHEIQLHCEKFELKDLVDELWRAFEAARSTEPDQAIYDLEQSAFS